ncbi:aspartate/glutamate racemase family protein [Rhodophyticola sp. CCM32]|uniref:aspartate/glutamate racemase family protein n=1 Tax=Rhodophyticola sp. CCM32 TaxID=2916397 RepID=UPI00107FC24C|nr:aspartate/glutamate racemase family protein [Rhodophyticola sp. CCM32]QBY00937.1 aspartate/glutamate racemase family protein [Rhodophyticola sp. CCM32]
MHIGLIGGIGPAATIVYYQRLITRMRTLDARLDLTIVQADVFDLIRNNNADNRSAQARIYAELLTRLKDVGADCAAITSLGGHFCYAETKALSPLPLISAITPLDAAFAAEGMTTVGLLGTEGVMRTGLYGQMTRTRTVAPENDLHGIGQLYQEIAVAGRCTDAQRTRLFDEGRRMIEDQGAQAIVMAGTDLGLAFDGHDPGYHVIDALDIHVALLARLASGQIGLRDIG